MATTFPGWICPGLIEAAHNCGPCVRRACEFPGWICPGLIEASSSRAGSRTQTTFPGWICPGLIEASWLMPDRDRKSPFPGWICPGLIEAGQQGGPRRSSLANFRGGSAPASLKRRGLAGAGRGLAGFPGWICPGLIEASSCSTRSVRGAGFPGWICPGLIEARSCSTRSVRSAGDFRGGSAPASLKHPAKAAAARAEGGISGVDLPRPH